MNLEWLILDVDGKRFSSPFGDGNRTRAGDSPSFWSPKENSSMVVYCIRECWAVFVTRCIFCYIGIAIIILVCFTTFSDDGYYIITACCLLCLLFPDAPIPSASDFGVCFGYLNTEPHRVFGGISCLWCLGRLEWRTNDVFWRLNCFSKLGPWWVVLFTWWSIRYHGCPIGSMGCPIGSMGCPIGSMGRDEQYIYLLNLYTLKIKESI